MAQSDHLTMPLLITLLVVASVTPNFHVAANKVVVMVITPSKTLH